VRAERLDAPQRLEELLTAAFLQWAKGVSHERALELARSQKTPAFFRKIALASIERFCGKGETRIVFVDAEVVA
jgi:hypothetical protein